MGDDELDIVLGTQFKGLEDAKAYAQVLAEIDKTTRSLQSARPVAYTPPPGYERAYSAFRQGAGGVPPRIGGIGDARQEDRKKLKDKLHDVSQSEFFEKMVNRGPRGDSFVSSLAKAGKIVSWVSLAATAFEVAAKEVYSFADATSKATLGMVSAQVALGSTAPQAAQVKLLGIAGADASKANAFQQRITTDPLAMGAAGSLGIGNLKDPYGDRNHATRYLSAIEQVSAIADEAQRKRLANVLGIEEEVAKYMLLSAKTREALKGGSSFAASFNDTKAQRAAAEFAASNELMKQANENLTSAIGQSFLPEVKGVIDTITGVENAAASAIRTATNRYRNIRAEMGGVIDLFNLSFTRPGGLPIGDLDTYKKAYEEVKAGFTGGIPDLVRKREVERVGSPSYGAVPMPPIGSSSSPLTQAPMAGGSSPEYSRQVSSVDANTMMLARVAEALVRLDKNIGLNTRSREAVDRMGGVNMRAALFGESQRQQFAFGALG